MSETNKRWMGAEVNGCLGPSTEPGIWLAVIPLGPTALTDCSDDRVLLEPAKGDLSLLASGRAPVLADHERHLGAVLGRVITAWIEDDCLAVLMRFAAVGRGAEVAALIADGTLSGVSLGSMVDEVTPPTWRPYEVSIVTVPRVWHARTFSGPPPAELLERQARLQASIAAGSRATWQSWPDRAAPALASKLGVAEQAAADSLRHVVAAELARCEQEALATTRAALGLAA